MAGLFFCLASADGAGLLFCPAKIQPNTSVYSTLLSSMQIIQPQHQKRLQGFTAVFPLI
jgi:hypothetical protein